MSVARLPISTPPALPQKTTAELFLELTQPLFRPRDVEMRRRCAEALKTAGAPEKYIAAVLAVPVEEPR
jgi:hypothetical protein